MGVGRGEVVVLEPEPGAYQQIKAALVEGGYEVSLLTTSRKLLPRIRRSVPEVVIIPLSENPLETVELVSALHERSADLPVVLICNEARVSQLALVLEAGASDYLIIPHYDDALVRHTIAACSKHRKEIRRRKRSERELKRLNRALVESVRALEQDQQAGYSVQKGMMPESPWAMDGLTLRHLIVPSLILSGDFIDYFELPGGRVLLYIADVSGHGVQGAIVTVLLKSLSARLANEFEELGLDGPGSILEWLNRELIACGLDQHVTMFLGVMSKDGTHLKYANAAQFPAAILQSDSKTEYLEMGGLPLGLKSDASYREREATLPDRYTMVMFSDGVFEILPDESLKAKEEHLLSLVRGDKGDIDSMADHLGLGGLDDVPDDIALFTVARAG